MNPTYKALLISYLDRVTSGYAGLREVQAAARNDIRAAVDALSVGQAELHGILCRPMPGLRVGPH